MGRWLTRAGLGVLLGAVAGCAGIFGPDNGGFVIDGVGFTPREAASGGMVRIDVAARDARTGGHDAMWPGIGITASAGVLYQSAAEAAAGQPSEWGASMGSGTQELLISDSTAWWVAPDSPQRVQFSISCGDAHARLNYDVR